MTEIQKQQIFSMRMQGIGYHVIGKTLDLKENQVQLYCKAHGLAGDPSLVFLNHAVWCEQNNRCAFCGKSCSSPGAADAGVSAQEAAARDIVC